jgi:hypothetical protein
MIQDGSVGSTFPKFHQLAEEKEEKVLVTW